MYKTSHEIFNRCEVPINNGKSALSVSLVEGGSRVKLTSTQNLSISNLYYEIDRSNDFIIKNISIVSDVPISEIVKVSVLSFSPNVETEVLKQELLNNSSVLLIPPNNYKIYSDEILAILCTNDNLIGNVTLVINIEEV